MDLPSLSTDPQALATIEAAKIAAGATARAAWIQAAAALGAIVAGALAYFGAVRQVRLEEHAHEARTVAYRFRLGKVVEDYLAQIASAHSIAKEQLTGYRANSTCLQITSLRISIPSALHDENWDLHALLGRRAVELILSVGDAGRRLAEFDREIREDSIRTDSHFDSGTLRMIGARSDGSPAYGPENAIVDYVEVLARLKDALVALRDELAKAPETPIWRKLLQRTRVAKLAAGRY